MIDLCFSSCISGHISIYYCHGLGLQILKMEKFASLVGSQPYSQALLLPYISPALSLFFTTFPAYRRSGHYLCVYSVKQRRCGFTRLLPYSHDTCERERLYAIIYQSLSLRYFYILTHEYIYIGLPSQKRDEIFSDDLLSLEIQPSSTLHRLLFSTSFCIRRSQHDRVNWFILAIIAKRYIFLVSQSNIIDSKRAVPPLFYSSPQFIYATISLRIAHATFRS